MTLEEWRVLVGGTALTFAGTVVAYRAAQSMRADPPRPADGLHPQHHPEPGAAVFAVACAGVLLAAGAERVFRVTLRREDVT